MEPTKTQAQGNCLGAICSGLSNRTPSNLVSRTTPLNQKGVAHETTSNLVQDRYNRGKQSL